MFDIFGHKIGYDVVTEAPLAEVVNTALERRGIKSNKAVSFVMTRSFIVNSVIDNQLYGLADYAECIGAGIEERRSRYARYILQVMETQINVDITRKRYDPMITYISGYDVKDKRKVCLPVLVEQVNENNNLLSFYIGDEIITITWTDFINMNMEEYAFCSLCLPVVSIIRKELLDVRPNLIRRGIFNLLGYLSLFEYIGINSSYGQWYYQKNIARWLEYSGELLERLNYSEMDFPPKDLLTATINCGNNEEIVREIRKYTAEWQCALLGDKIDN